MEFEMIACPVCGNPMPKKRQELGYNYCVNCSTEGRKVCVVEGTVEGDGVQSDIVIMTSEQARAITKANLGIVKLENDELPDMQTFEQQDILNVQNGREMAAEQADDPDDDFSPRELQEMEEDMVIDFDEEEDEE